MFRRGAARAGVSTSGSKSGSAFSASVNTMGTSWGSRTSVNIKSPFSSRFGVSSYIGSPFSSSMGSVTVSVTGLPSPS